MSVEINWDILTGGSDGQELAEVIRQFVHDRFQQIALPKLIRSVKVHAFDFGTVAPHIVLKDVCEPLPDFYEQDDDGGEGENGAVDDDDCDVAQAHLPPPVTASTNQLNAHAQTSTKPATRSRRPSEQQFFGNASISTPALTRGAIMGSTSNFGYFHLPGMGAGTTTPLAAVAGAQYQNNNGRPQHGLHSAPQTHRESGSPTTTSSPVSRPVSQDHHQTSSARHASVLQHPDQQQDNASSPPSHVERSPEDLQVVFHATYAGDVRLSMTADVFLDYPMPSFVGIPLKLNITGLTFNGVGVLAYIRKRAHLCFLSPEDAEALVGSEGKDDAEEDGAGRLSRVGALLEEIKIDSEMGESGEGQQVLKNVGKIEKFILEQVQKLFEEEFVYPSFWTFLV